ncbi:LacI family DNA-binding transcriptional regulator [Xanthomonas massiliensis]|uniref:LacI family DNA-binding transcriptional regulator n=1 Tax=Xanthomonas massiliensis TaxID=1720302 RepID=UPI00082627B3|nr:LacI family DNA-binding transcriptional regulator [Xanthomonas massiliensis]
MAKGSITIRDVARLAGVSVATVSRALNGRHNVAEPVRERVVEAARQLHYSPNAAARSLSSRRTQTLGVVLPDLHGEFFSELIRGIDAVARQQDRHLLVSSYHGDPQAQVLALQSMRGRVDGLLVLSPYVESPGWLAANLPADVPAVLVNTRMPADDAHAVLNIDDHAGAVAMTEHLLGRGYRDIAFISGPASNYDAGERLRGFRDAIAAHGPGIATRVLEGDFDEAAGHRAGQALLASGALPQAVFAANDMMALGCLYAFTQAGLRVPEQIALAGFDDIPLARFVHPALTTMRVSIAELGRKAASRLVAQIDSGAPADGFRQELVPELVVRESTGVPTRGAARGTDPL